MSQIFLCSDWISKDVCVTFICPRDGLTVDTAESQTGVHGCHGASAEKAEFRRGLTQYQTQNYFLVELTQCRKAFMRSYSTFLSLAMFSKISMANPGEFAAL
jgi:hypothetical protein